MSPEQAEGQNVDLRTDIFSLGICLWELLANDRLFVANNEINTLRKIRDCQIPSLRKVNPNIHTELERIVQKSLARDRNLRYQTGAALHRDLNRFLNRQYPDFSSQDFAVFIKSVFADEILSLRKRLVEYSQLNVNGGNAASRGNPNFDDRTSLLDGGTNSLIVAEGEVTGSEVSEVTEPSVAKPNANANTHWAASADTAIATSTGTSDSESYNPKVIGPMVPKDSMSLVLDEKAIAADIRRKVGSGRGYSDDNEVTNVSRSRSSRSKRRDRSRSGSMRFATMTVFCLLTLSVYAYLVKYFTPLMSEVITATDPVLHSFHVALGVDPSSLPTAPRGEPRTPATQPPDPTMAAPMPSLPPSGPTISAAGQAPHMTPPSQPVATAPAPPTQFTPNETAPDDANIPSAIITVTSNPSGASIWINDKNTGMVTPSRVDVPARKRFSIVLRKRGYASHRMINTSKEEIGSKVAARLMKQNVAYVDVDVFPPMDVTILVNGKPYRGRLPIQDIEIPANTQVKVRAEAKVGGSFDELTVNLPADKRQSIQLNPRKNMRQPSNSQ
jgi:hypothetical protein